MGIRVLPKAKSAYLISGGVKVSHAEAGKGVYNDLIFPILDYTIIDSGTSYEVTFTFKCKIWKNNSFTLSYVSEAGAQVLGNGFSKQGALVEACRDAVYRICRDYGYSLRINR